MTTSSIDYEAIANLAKDTYDMAACRTIMGTPVFWFLPVSIRFRFPYA